MKMEKEVKVSVNNNKIELESWILANEVRSNFVRKVVDTEDLLIREALIKIGWTPPKDKQ